MIKLVFGVGVNDRKYPTFANGKKTKECSLWNNMLKRCYSEKHQLKQPTYIGCEVSENFKHYSYFYEWCQKQIGFGNQGFHLDKDLLVKGNKIYSENMCVFIPRELNCLLLTRDAERGEHPLGVYWNKKDKAFIARVNKREGNREYLGSFKTEIEAFNAYKLAKEAYLKEIAEKYKSQIDLRAYDALMNYTVNIDD